MGSGRCASEKLGFRLPLLKPISLGVVSIVALQHSTMQDHSAMGSAKPTHEMMHLEVDF